MDKQNQIKRTLSQPVAIKFVAETLEGGKCAHRSALANLVCKEFGFYDLRGRAQRDGCLKALRELEAAGHFKLPAALSKGGPKTPKRLAEAVGEPTGVPVQAGEVGGLGLILVSGEEEMRIWNELMIREREAMGHWWDGRCVI